MIIKIIIGFNIAVNSCWFHNKKIVFPKIMFANKEKFKNEKPTHRLDKNVLWRIKLLGFTHSIMITRYSK